MNKLLKLTLTFICVFDSFLLYSWRPAGHYSVARVNGYLHSEAGAFNLPDAWDSYDITGSITDNFCWGHSVRRNGTTFLIPNSPVYELSREPGKIIKELALSKVVNWGTNNNKNIALNTAKYFTGGGCINSFWFEFAEL